MKKKMDLVVTSITRKLTTPIKQTLVLSSQFLIDLFNQLEQHVTFSAVVEIQLLVPLVYLWMYKIILKLK